MIVRLHKYRSLLLLLCCFWFQSCRQSSKYIYNEGHIYGTIYHIVYESPAGDDFFEEITKKLDNYNRTFSTFDDSSIISKINNNLPVELNPYFLNCYKRAMEISEITDGAFDITSGALVNAWGFGPGEREIMTPGIIDSLKQITGYQKISLKDGVIEKEHDGIKLDMSGIAKGYTCDLLGKFLEDKGCKNYMVEIGGEVVVKGKNEKGRVWTIGISKPDEDLFFFSNVLQAKVGLPENSLATSGNYRNYYVEDGKKYAHTIDPRSGYPVQHSLLSATVMADSCIDADAFATAFMVLGLEKSIKISMEIPDIKVYFIYSNEKGENSVYMSENFSQNLIK